MGQVDTRSLKPMTTKWRERSTVARWRRLAEVVTIVGRGEEMGFWWRREKKVAAGGDVVLLAYKRTRAGAIFAGVVVLDDHRGATIGG